MNDALERLRTTGEKLPPKLREEIVALGAEAIPPLIALLTAEDVGNEDAPGQGYPPIHAVELLADLKAVEAIEPMLDVLVETTFDHIINSTLSRRLPEFGERVLEPALDRLADVKVDGADSDTEQALVAVLAQLGVNDERIFEAICDVFEDDVVMGALALGDYGDPRALPMIEEAILDFEPDFSSVFWRNDLTELLDAHERLGGILDDELREHIEAVDARWEQVAAQRQRAGARKVGRNDACPCGSGKKYKKCCIDSREASPAPSVITREGDRFITSGNVTPEALATAQRFFAEKDAGRGPAQQMMDFVAPLLDAEDPSRDKLRKALDVGMLFWNAAIAEPDRRKELLDKMAEAFDEGEERTEFLSLAQTMVERHVAMFPEMHARMALGSANDA